MLNYRKLLVATSLLGKRLAALEGRAVGVLLPASVAADLVYFGLHWLVGRMAGLSRGGSWALYLGTAHWDLFGSIGAHSTAPFFGMDSWLTYYINQMGKHNYPRLFVDFGESDSLLPYMQEFKKKLDGYKLHYEYRMYPGNHTEEYWSAHVEEYLRWYWKLWSRAEE